MPSVSIIVPTYREAENLPLLVPAVAQAMRLRGWGWELIVVDDNSQDATPLVLADLAKTFPQVHFQIRTHERGLSSAVLAGIALAQNEYVVVMDADLSHPPESVPDLVDMLIRGEADFVIGSRYVPGGRTEDWGFFRWLNSAGATLLAKPIVGAVRDPMAGFFALRRDALANAGPLNPIGYKIALELIVKCGVRHVAEVPIVFRNRVHGESKLTMKEQFRYLEHLSRLYDYRFPKGSPRAKFIVAAGCGATACGLSLGLLDWAGWPFVASMAVGLLAMIAVTLVFFARYVKTQRAFTPLKHPWWEFLYISMAEFITGWTFAVATNTNSLLIRAGIGVMVLLLVRYTLRKVFLHDLRGIRVAAKPAEAQVAVLRMAQASARAAGA